MRLIHSLLLAALPLALASSLPTPFDEPSSPTDLHGSPTSSCLTCLTKPNCPGRKADEKLQAQLFEQFSHTLYVERNISKAFETYVAFNIIEHDPYDTQNRRDIIARLSQIIPSAKLTILSSSFGNNMGLIHLKVAEHPEPLALADIYRMDGTCIVEHWDVSQARPANATNPIAMF